MSKLKIVEVPIEDLIPYANNARTHSDEQVAQIAASIREFGWTNPILVDKQNGIIAGHGRLAAARKLKMDKVPAIQLDELSEAQKKALILADNKLALNSGWDDKLLAIELADLKEMDFDISVIGFSPDEIAALQPEIEEVDGLTDEDDVPDVPVEPVTKLGDVWLLGRHRLMCGDSTSIDVVRELCQEQLVDMWLTDPPYNVAVQGGDHSNPSRKNGLKIQNDAMGDDQFRQFLSDAYTAADASMKPGAVFYIWHANKESYNFQRACKDCGWQVRQHLVWKKSSIVMGQQDYHYKHEPCLYGWKEGAGHLWASDRKQTTILEFNRPSRNAEHPTMKPVELFEYQMLNNTKGGDIVLDSFSGSGTTVIAAEKNGRIARLMELDPKYCDVIVKRWQDFTGKEATLESTSETFNELNHGT
jgi:DNA modification methylase